MSGPAATERDPADPRLARGASGLLREFNQAGILTAADVHVARRLGRLAGETDPAVLLAVALAVRAPRLGHVLVDLEQIRATAAVDGEEIVDLETLSWPAPEEWVRAVRASPLVRDEARGGALGSEPLRLAGSWLYLDRYWAEESAVAEALRELAGEPAEAIDEVALTESLDRLFGDGARDGGSGSGGGSASAPDGGSGSGGGSSRAPDGGPARAPDGGPARAAELAARRRLAVIAGGPGTGKTTTVARIVALLSEQALALGAPLPLVALAAPTGKAAARLAEAVQAEAVGLEVAEPVRRHLLDLPAVTIHRLLGWRPGSASRFRHDRTQRLPHDVVIVDETSMVSLSLMARLIEALRSSARLILVGDPGQLASIEAGAVLGDIVAAGTEGSALGAGTVLLRRVHRFGGVIAGLAEAVRSGDGDATVSRLREGSPDITWLELDPAAGTAPDLILAPALEAARTMVSAAQRGDATVALQALNACRILCAHRRGPSGVSTWTSRMESQLAAELPDLDPEERWYLGRPLLVTENDYELRLNNGDIGVVVARDQAGGAVAAFERRGVPGYLSPSRLGAIETVYAMTIHKSQGSQFATAAVLLPEPGSRLLTRELLYTAVTRAQRRLIVAGTEESVRSAVGRPVARASGLALRLRGGMTVA